MVGLGNYIIYVTSAMVAIRNYIIYVTSAILGLGNYVIGVTSGMAASGTIWAHTAEQSELWSQEIQKIIHF